MVLSQFCTDDAVNQLFDYSKCVVDQICGCEERPKKLKEIQYLIFAGMISYYGFEQIDNITRAFKENQFFYTKEKMLDYLSKQNISQQTLSSIDNDTYAFFNQTFFYKKSTNEYFVKGKIVVSDDNNAAPDNLIEYTVHEINHAVNSVKKRITSVGNGFIIRTGVYSKDFRDGSRKNKLLEESFNVLQSAEIMDHILNFTNYKINDKEIKYVLDSINYAANKKRRGLGYAHVTSLVRPLYENSNFNIKLKKNRMDGEIKIISDDFDSIIGKGSFDRLGSQIDEFYYGTLVSGKKANVLIKEYVSRR